MCTALLVKQILRRLRPVSSIPGQYHLRFGIRLISIISAGPTLIATSGKVSGQWKLCQVHSWKSDVKLFYYPFGKD